MKIWTITTDQDGEGTATAVHMTEADAKGHYGRIIAASWASWFGSNAAPMPDDTAKAWEVLTMQTGFMDSVTLTEHDISHHPAIAAALAAFDAMQNSIQDGQDMACNDETAAAMDNGWRGIRDALGVTVPTAGLSPANCIPPKIAAALAKEEAAQAEQEAAYRAAAQRLHHKEGEIEIDDAALVSLGDDPGAYVQAWIWVSAAAAGIDTDDEGDDE
jgi:hypothetical protein